MDGLRMDIPGLDLEAVDAPPEPALEDAAERLSLRVEKRFNVLETARLAANKPTVGTAALKPDGADSYPLFVAADHVSGQAGVLTEAEGRVELRQSGYLVLADRLSYRPLDDEVEASGNVHMARAGVQVDAPYLKMRMSEQIGFADQAAYQLVRDVASKVYDPTKTVVSVATSSGSSSGAPMMLNVSNTYGLPTRQPPPRRVLASGDAERIEFEGENQVRLEGASYSTCKPDARDWYLRASDMQLDFDSNEGRASHASLWFQNVPLFYTPTAWFPLNDARRSGFLNPSISQSTRTGIDIALPYYWNIAPNYDASFYPRYMSKRGLQLGSELRHLGETFQGEARGEYLADDIEAGKTRYAYAVRESFAKNAWSGKLDWNGVSDDHYWTDMSSRLLQTSQSQLTRRAMLNYTPSPWLQTSLQVLRYQTLQTVASDPIERPYFLEPQLNMFAYRPGLLKTDFSMIGQYSRFTHDDRATKDQGDRVVLYPQLTLPIIHPAFQILPKVGVHMSSYALDRSQANAGAETRVNRVLPIVSIDSTMVFERQDSLFGKGYVQTLEPRLYYLNIPYKDQSAIPLFDTALNDFNFAQIFSENRYSGYDRINDANQLTAAVTTRILDDENGVERFKAMIGQRYYFDKQRVAITGETTRQQDFSNLIAAVNGLVAPKTYVEAAWEYNYKTSTSERFAAGVRFQPDYGKVLSASYRYTRDPLTASSTVDQIDLAGQWPLAANWYAVGRYNYSLKDSQLLESIAGLEYNAGCWAVRSVFQRLAAVSGSPNDSVFLQLELNDFTRIGSNPLGLLRRSIPGYGKSNELPANDNSLITSP